MKAKERNKNSDINSGKKQVIIIGGGFAGLQLVKNLDKRHFNVLLIDKINHHQFQPLFYQVATSQLVSPIHHSP